MTKAELRRDVRHRLHGLDAAARAAAGLAVAARVWTVPEVAAARTLLLFAPLPDELPIDAVAGEARRRGVRCVYPRVLADRTLALHLVEHAAALVPGAYGIREPDPHAAPRLDPGEVDAALVPGLAWDRAGQRLGRGAGFYDRLFAERVWRGVRCGVFLAAQEVPAIPRDPWDEPLHLVVTERETLRFGG